ncbi:hypothetical protein [Paraburkholderia lycopersici]|uniref:hypothetical protein n=1 Tax=Paraburkholderia lycopersici TaxID=416944 RepID=UPI0015A2E1B6|nr:hypothetical protein [Paraburkholderia lycopersici]
MSDAIRKSKSRASPGLRGFLSHGSADPLHEPVFGPAHASIHVLRLERRGDKAIYF